mmetsp:Transcript_46421/g.68574  ORF Transcript_46421/g.68574 Transcript_46421/m.68574 type:complete len:237 (+) Transcript_46421:200-910(+)
MRPTRVYFPSPSSRDGDGPDDMGGATFCFDFKAAMAPSRSSICENSQSAALSEAPSQCFKAARTWSAVKQPRFSTRDITVPSSTSLSTKGEPTNCARPSSVPLSGRGSLKSGSQLCSKIQSMAASTFDPPTAISALLHPLMLNPIPMSCPTAFSSIVGPAGAAGVELSATAFSSSSGTRVSPLTRDVLRNSRSICCGISIFTSSFLGTQSGPSSYRWRCTSRYRGKFARRFWTDAV